MIHFRKNSDSAIIVLHEIYGLNRHIVDFGRALSDYGFDVFCPSVYNQETTFDYADEEAAYMHFTENVGFFDASQEIKTIISQLKNRYQKVIIIGFSVGATAAWLCSEEDHVSGIGGYYGSRIRDYMDMAPACPVMLFFPEEERSFRVDELRAALKEKGIETHKLAGLHGFADPYSMRYNRQSAQTAFRHMMRFLKGL